MDVAAVLLFGKESVLAGAILVETRDLRLPLLFKLGPHRRVASLPIVTADVVDLETSLVKFQPLACEIEQWPQQSLHVVFIAPNQECQRGVATLGFVQPI